MRSLPVSLAASLMEWMNKYSKNAKVLLTKLLLHFCFSFVEFVERFFWRNCLLYGLLLIEERVGRKD